VVLALHPESECVLPEIEVSERNVQRLSPSAIHYGCDISAVREE